MKLSIRYDMTFQACLIHFTDDQLDPALNPNEAPPTLEQEQHANQSFAVLCDTIDRYAERYHQAQMQKYHEAQAKSAGKPE